jgi:hypothetical protein
MFRRFDWHCRARRCWDTINGDQICECYCITCIIGNTSDESDTENTEMDSQQDQSNQNTQSGETSAAAAAETNNTQPSDHMGNKGSSQLPGSSDNPIVVDDTAPYLEIADAIADNFILEAIDNQDLYMLNNVLKAKVRLKHDILNIVIMSCSRLIEMGTKQAHRWKIHDSNCCC